MTIKRFAVLTALISITLHTAAAHAETQLGAIEGLVSTNGAPLADARVTLHREGSGAEQNVVSDRDGAFAIRKLRPGRYELIITKDGYQPASATVQVAEHDNVSVKFSLSTVQAAGAAVTSGVLPAELAKELDGMKKRIEQLEAQLKTVQAQAPMAANNEGNPALPLYASLANPTLGSLPRSAAVPGATTPAAPAQPAASPAPATPSIPEALQAPAPTTGVDNSTPFAFGDFTWLNGTPRNKDEVLDTKFFTPEVRFDSYFAASFNQPRDHTLGGSTELFRSGEFQVEQAGVGGDFHWQNVRGRILFMEGMFATTTPRNDPSPGNGQWDLRDAYRYVSEAYGGYHFDVAHGLNIDAGIFVSYIGLFSYYNFDNWTYQPSYVSSNTPWFFNGLRIQWFPTNKLKIEPWIINGWQSYARANGHHGFGGQILYRPKEWLSLVFNNYGNGTDTLGNPNRVRLHTDDSIEVRYFNNPESTGLSKIAFSFTGDLGCEYGGGVTCHGGKGGPKQAFLGWMLYNRFWFNKDRFAITAGGGMMSNPGRYLTLLPPIDGADAISGSPYFSENPGDKAHMWDTTLNFQYMPRQYLTWWFEMGYRHSDVPYWSGRGGITPPGGNNGSPQYYTCTSGASAGTADLNAAYAACGGAGSVWFPDLRRSQASISAGVLVKF